MFYMFMLKQLVKSALSRRPELYWRFWGAKLLADPWQKRIFPQQSWLRQQIKKLKPASVLEVGCGFGRNLKFLLEQGIGPEILTGVDISAQLLEQADLPVRLVRANVLNLPFTDRQFDLVFTHGLLMHLAPRQLPRALAELTRVSRKYLILIEEIRTRPQQLNYFTFAHDYDKILAKLPLKVMVKKKGRYWLSWYLLKKSSMPTGAGLTRTSC